MKIVHVVGARPNFMKIAPVMKAIGRARFAEQKLVHTGQHYDFKMSDVFFTDLGMPVPDIHLGVGSGSHAEQTAKVLVGFEKASRAFHIGEQERHRPLRQAHADSLHRRRKTSPIRRGLDARLSIDLRYRASIALR